MCRTLGQAHLQSLRFASLRVRFPLGKVAMGQRRRWSIGLVVGSFALTLVSTAPAAAATSATDGTRVLTVSQTTDLDPAGQVVTADGSGYDESKGVYVAFCV